MDGSRHGEKMGSHYLIHRINSAYYFGLHWMGIFGFNIWLVGQGKLYLNKNKNAYENT